MVEKTLNFKRDIYEILKNDKRIWVNGSQLNKTKLIDLIDNNDDTLIKLLFSNLIIRKKFFKSIDENAYVFKNIDFKYYIEEYKLDNSYTVFKNRIGLTQGKHFIVDADKVVLNFPYKDCILEGSQTREDGKNVYFEYSNGGYYKVESSNRNEIFLNEIVNHEDIDRLLDEKVLVSWKRFTIDGEEKVEEIKRNINGCIQENLILKGNNLIALHCLKKEFKNRVKLIYIDPPFNTGSDSFKYNDNFSHSTWLVFMKNRLSIAKQLLREDGFILIHCDDNEYAYLKVLMDELYGRKNYLNTISIKSKHGAGIGGYNKKVMIQNFVEYILVYAKNKEKQLFNIVKIHDVCDNKYLKCFNRIAEVKSKEKTRIDSFKFKDKEIVIYKVNTNVKKVKKEDRVKEYYIRNSNILFQTTNGKDPIWQKVCEYLSKFQNDENIYTFVIYKNKKRVLKKEEMYFYKKRVVLWLKKNTILKKDILLREIPFNNFLDFAGFYNSLSHEGGIDLKKAKKPEVLLKYIIELCTNEEDIVLDYFLGSGTTSAVAHKLNRQYIGIEQLDYGKNDSIVRLKNVIKGDKSGISKKTNWKGGGSFIVCELKKWNEDAKRKINNINNTNELKSFFTKLYNDYFLNYNLKSKEFVEKAINKPEFNNLSLNEQKMIFIEMLDNNQMYVNLSEMEDEKFGINKKDQELNKMFYLGIYE